MVNILIVGANGYIGQPLALDLRRKGHTVYGLVRSIEKGKELAKGEVRVVVGDGTKTETLVEVIKKVDVVVNTAMDFSNPNSDIDSVNAISRAIEQAGGTKKKFIFVSGFLVVEPSDTPQTADTPTLSEKFIDNLDPELAFFKGLLRNRIAAEKTVTGSKTYAGTAVRAPMVYGGYKGHYSIHFKNAEEGKLITYGDGNTVISFVHLDDFVEGLVKVVLADTSKVEHQIFSLAEPARVTQREVGLACARATGKDIKDLKEEKGQIPFVPKMFEKGHLWVDPSKATNVLGWTPGHNLIRDATELYESWKALGTEARW